MTLLSYLCLFFAPVIYIINIRQVHIFCEINLPNQVTNLIKFLTPVPSELTVRTIAMFYSFLLTIIIFKLALNFVTMLLFLLL
jgi:hypothetical protein